MVGSKRVFIKIVLKIFKIVLQLINVVTIAGLLAIHFIIKERTYWSSLFFYAIPLPVIIFIVLSFSVVLTKKWRRYNLIIASVLMLLWLGRSFKIHFPDKIDKNAIEVVFWNASHDNDFQTVNLENEHIPDVMVLVESEKNNINRLKIKYPNYYFYKSQREIFIFSKKSLIIESENISKKGTSVINFKTWGVNFYAIDVQGSIDISREPELIFVSKNIIKKTNTIVLGDFNTPYESVYLKQIKKDFNQAFNKKGNGFRETWFNNLPVLSLDHIWVSKDLKVLKTEKFYSLKSDHSMLKTVVRK